MTDQKPTPERPEALTIDQVAERLQVNRNTVAKMIDDGVIRARNIGRHWRIPAAALAEFLDGRDNPVKALSVDDVAAALQLHRNTVAAMIDAGEIRAIRAGKAGKLWRVSAEALAEFLDGRDNPMPAEPGTKAPYSAQAGEEGAPEPDRARASHPLMARIEQEPGLLGLIDPEQKPEA
jgi:excisionase family DNA binding protein